MPAPRQAAVHDRTKGAVALLLTFAAGSVDIVGYLSVYRTFTAHMTGDTVHLGNNLLERHWWSAALAAAVIGAFLLGSIFGRALVEVGARRRVRRIASANLLVEAALIALVIELQLRGLEPVPVLLVLLATAMGVQTSTLTRVGSLTIHTTFVTGMLNKLAQLLSHAAFTAYDLLRGRPARKKLPVILRQAQFISSIWLLYLAGAVLGTWLRSLWAIRALLVPMGVVLLALAIDQIAPLSVEEEYDQTER